MLIISSKPQRVRAGRPARTKQEVKLLVTLILQYGRGLSQFRGRYIEGVKMKNLEHNQQAPDECTKSKPKKKVNWGFINLLITVGRGIVKFILFFEGDDFGD